MGDTGVSLASLAQVLTKYPQVVINVNIRQRQDPFSSPKVQAAVEWVKQRLGADRTRCGAFVRDRIAYSCYG